MSSTIAIVRSRSFIPAETRERRSASTPTANAMSVAAGIAQPLASGVPAQMARKIAAGSDDAAQRGEHRERRRAALAQLTESELALDLQADDEEEDRHQRVVDPVAQVELEHAEVELARPQRRVAVTRDVRPYEGADGGRQERRRTGRLVVEEVPQAVVTPGPSRCT